ncbi:SWIM zinc finger family protein [Paenibacillus daejeonensis]|uniref:SWIM zinc finger family protein n=1 Tax=Paenibacillus daejeonensis TaxID=135193 RepID=UPI00037C157F|nr:SWIM zinc finger family protein [Paenibacillus daejeonensis]
MIALTESLVDTLAPNSAAAKNGRDLVKKNKLTKLHKSEDDSLIFGECAGSGKSGYSCSADFRESDTPLVRCNCPSRQFPCKHGLALLYAYAGGAAFTVAEVPADLEAKREKAEKRSARKAAQEESAATAEAPAKPKKINKAAWAKKIKAQLEGLEMLEKLVLSFIRGGLGTVDKRSVTQLREGVKSLGNSYLPGAQNELRGLTLALEQAVKAGDVQEQVYAGALERLLRIHALIRKGRPYLEAKLEDPDLTPDIESPIEEWLGHAWQLSELQAHGLVRANRELIQLAFHSYDDGARGEYVDAGYWLELDTGEVHRSLNYRPYKAAKYIKSEDSTFHAIRAGELYVYPGTWNRRIRMEQTSMEEVLESHRQRARETAETSVAEAVKKVRGELKDPLGNKSPVLLLHAAAIQATADGQPVLVDHAGAKLQLGDVIGWQATTPLLRVLPQEALSDAVFVLLFQHDPLQQRLVAQPIAIIQPTGITRLW